MFQALGDKDHTEFCVLSSVKFKTVFDTFKSNNNNKKKSEMANSVTTPCKAPLSPSCNILPPSIRVFLVTVSQPNLGVEAAAK